MLIELDDNRWRRTVESLAKVNRNTVQKQLKLAARNVIEECLSMTPPLTGRKGFGKDKSTITERTKAGTERVAKDIYKTMRPIGSLRIMTKTGKETRASATLTRYLKAGRTDKLEETLRALGIYRFEDVAQVAEKRMHEGQRFKGGVHSKFAKRFLIIKDASLTAYVKHRQKEVWKAVSGWNKAAKGIGARPAYWPAAAKKHSQPGKFAQSPKTSDDTWFEFANRSRYIQSKGRELNIMSAAFRGTQGKLEKDLAHQLQLAHAKASHPP